MQSVNFPHGHIQLAGSLYLPENFNENNRYPAIVVVHPAGGVKEQTAGTYAQELAKIGFVAVAYDAAYQGESTGEPRYLENPHIRTADVSAAVDFLTTLEFVDNERIGVLGVCAGGGYGVAAAMQDRRIKVVGTVSAVNIGDGTRYSWGGRETVHSQGLISQLEQVAQIRTGEANGGETTYVPLTPPSTDGITLPDMLEAIEYYHTPRAYHPRAVSRMALRNLMQLATFDAYHLADVFLTQPLMIVVGDKANTLWFSEDLYRKAASQNKTLYIVEGATHIAMYDKFVPQAMEALGKFYQENL